MLTSVSLCRWYRGSSVRTVRCITSPCRRVMSWPWWARPSCYASSPPVRSPVWLRCYGDWERQVVPWAVPPVPRCSAWFLTYSHLIKQAIRGSGESRECFYSLSVCEAVDRPAGKWGRVCVLQLNFHLLDRERDFWQEPIPVSCFQIRRKNAANVFLLCLFMVACCSFKSRGDEDICVTVLDSLSYLWIPLSNQQQSCPGQHSSERYDGTSSEKSTK